MSASQSPIFPRLSSDDHALIAALLDCSRGLADIARDFGCDLLTLAERILAEPVQTALLRIRTAAGHTTTLRAAVFGPACVQAFAAAASIDNPSLPERRRAASALSRLQPRPAHPPHEVSAPKSEAQSESPPSDPPSVAIEHAAPADPLAVLLQSAALDPGPILAPPNRHDRTRRDAQALTSAAGAAPPTHARDRPRQTAAA